MDCGRKKALVVRVDGIKAVFSGARKMEGVRRAQEHRLRRFHEHPGYTIHHPVCQFKEEYASCGTVGFELAGNDAECFPADQALADLAKTTGVELRPAMEGTYQRITSQGTCCNFS